MQTTTLKFARDKARYHPYIQSTQFQFKLEKHITLRHITDHFKYHFESVHVVGEIVLTGLLCKYPIYFALSKATVPVLTYTSVRKYRVKGSIKLNVNPTPLSYSFEY